MSYRLQFASGAKLDGLSPSTRCLVIGVALANAVGAFYAYAKGALTEFFTLFTFYNSSNALVASVPLATTQLSSIALGAQVLADDGTGTTTWRPASVIGDGVSLVVGPVLAVGARAAIVSPTNLPPITPITRIAFSSQASDGTAWFIVDGNAVQAGVMTTLGAVPVGSTAFVEVQVAPAGTVGAWQLFPV
jgi:hypothetical protein